MTSVRQKIFRNLEDGTLTPQSVLDDVIGIGPYLHRRFQRTLQTQNDISLQRFWRFFSTKSTAQTLRLIRRSLQNERANQCVASSATNLHRSYHTGDINRMGYEAVVSLLDYRRIRQGGGVMYGNLPVRLTERSVSSKQCACKIRCDGPCRLTNDGLCVPRSHNTRGFEGVKPQDGQKVVRRPSRGFLPLSAALQADPDSRADMQNNHLRNVTYSRIGQTRWRRPGPKVRVPR